MAFDERSELDAQVRQDGKAEQNERDTWTQTLSDSRHEGKEAYDMDIDRMINEGLGGGQVTVHNGLITESTTDYMERDEP